MRNGTGGADTRPDAQWHVLDAQEIDDVLLGATILGCGGGGELTEGRELVARVHAAGLSCALAPLDSLPPDGIIAWVYGVGGLTVDREDARYQELHAAAEHPSVLAVRALEQHLGRPIAALVPGELGGTSMADVLYPAAMLGLPVVDGDPVGRAVPELHHSLSYLHGLPITPQAVVNEFGETALITKVVDDRRAEALVRSLAVASRNVVWVADHAQQVKHAAAGLIPGSVSGALAVGSACRRACAAGEDVPAALVAAAGGRVAFRGTVKSCMWEERGGFTTGEMRLQGREADLGASYRVWFKNENLMAWRDEAVDVTCPDLICAWQSEVGLPLTNPNAVAGMKVDLVAVPAPAGWRTPRGVAELGPRSFGFDVDYVPVLP